MKRMERSQHLRLSEASPAKLLLQLIDVPTWHCQDHMQLIKSRKASVLPVAEIPGLKQGAFLIHILQISVTGMLVYTTKYATHKKKTE